MSMKTYDMQEAMQRASVKAELLQRIQLRVWEYMDTPELKRDGIAMAMDIENMVREDERQQLIDEVVSKALKLYREKYSHVTRDYQPVDAFRDDIITLLQTIK